MLADFSAKPLQDELFIFYKQIVMDTDLIQDVINMSLELKERVNNRSKYSSILISELEFNEQKSDEIIENKKNESTTDTNEAYVYGVRKKRYLKALCTGSDNTRINEKDKKASKNMDTGFYTH